MRRTVTNSGGWIFEPHMAVPFDRARHRADPGADRGVEVGMEATDAVAAEARLNIRASHGMQVVQG